MQEVPQDRPGSEKKTESLYAPGGGMALLRLRNGSRNEPRLVVAILIVLAPGWREAS